MAWMQANAVNLFLALVIGWMLWQRLIAPRLAGVKSLDAAGYMRLRGEPHTLLDVRTAAEWAGGHPAQAVHMPLAEVAARCDELPKDRPVVCICASGMRSAQAARVLAKHGFASVYNFSGGMRAWAQAGLPVRQ
ncbi:MAG: rhodanese-like domain-containing protein [Mariprofundaceae bacterium]